MHHIITAKAKSVGFVDNAKELAYNAAAAAGICATYALCQVNAFALSIKSDYKIKEMDADFNPEGIILGLGFWIARLIGVSLIVWGIYGYITARKDGEAESMTGAIGKFVSGVVLVAMPSVLTGLGII